MSLVPKSEGPPESSSGLLSSGSVSDSVPWGGGGGGSSGGPCDPDLHTIEVTHIEDDGMGGDTYTYVTMTGGLNAGEFTGAGPGGRILVLYWDELAGSWKFTDPAHGTAGPTFPTTRCDPVVDEVSGNAYYRAEYAAIVGLFVI